MSAPLLVLVRSTVGLVNEMASTSETPVGLVERDVIVIDGDCDELHLALILIEGRDEEGITFRLSWRVCRRIQGTNKIYHPQG